MQRSHKARRLPSIRWIVFPSATAAFGLAVACASAATVKWDSSGTSPASPVAGSGIWDTTTKRWSTGSKDNAWSNGGTDTAQFGNPGTSTPTITLAAALYATGLTFVGGSYYFTDGGNTSYGFELEGAASIQLSSNSHVTVSGLFYDTLATISGSGTFVTSGAGDNSGSGFVVDSGVTLICDKTYNTGHAIGGSDSPDLLVKSGGLAQLMETGSAGQVSGQFYTGAIITINSGGILDMNADSETATSMNISGNGVSSGGSLINSASSTTSTLTLNSISLLANSYIGGAGNLVIDAPIGGSYAVTKVGLGTLTLASSNGYTGGTTISAGILSISGDANLGGSGGSLTFTGGTLQLTAGITSSRSLIMGTGGGTIDTGTFSSTLSGETSGGTLTVTDNGSLTLSGNVDNSGLGVIVNNGATVVLAKSSGTNVHAIGGGGIVINSGGTAQLAGSGNNQIYGNGEITVNIGGVFDLNGRNQDNAGTAGSILLSGTGIGGHGGLINSAASTTSTLTLYPDTLGNGVIFLLADSSIGGAGNLVINGSIQDPDTVDSYAVTKVGGGTLTLTGSNTYTGTTISAGTLSISSDANLGDPSGSLTFTGGTLQVTVGITSSRSVVTGTGGGTIDTGSFSSTFSGEVSGGTLTVIDNGSLTLSGSVDNNGLGVIVNSGATVILAKSSNPNVHAIGNGGIVINSGGTAQLAGSGNNQIYGSGEITVNSGGVFDFNGQNQDNAGMSGTILLSGTGIGGGGALINSAASTTSTLSLYPDTLGNGVIFLLANSSIGGAGNLVINGEIQDPDTVDSYAINKVGGGTLTLTGANTYAGGTTINAGILLANTTASSATGTGNVAVTTGGTLGGGPRTNGGAGHISGSVTISNGVTQAAAGHITAGNANPSQARYTAQDSDTGTLDIGGNLTLQGPDAPFTTGNNSGGTYLWKIDAANGTHDQIAVTGSILLATANGPFNLVVEQIGPDVTASTPIDGIIASASQIDIYSNPANPTTFTAYSLANGNVPSIGVPLSSSIFAISDNTNGYGSGWAVEIEPDANGSSVDLVVTGSVPEPGTLGVLSLATTGLLRRRRLRTQ